jgi:hypothetical protein
MAVCLLLLSLLQLFLALHSSVDVQAVQPLLQTVPDCLASRERAAQAATLAQCERHAVLFPRQCLRTRVPRGAPYARVKRCFRCCVLLWSHRLGLAQHLDYWRQPEHILAIGQKHGVQEAGGVLLSHNDDLRFSFLGIPLYNYFNQRPWPADQRECPGHDCGRMPHGAYASVQRREALPYIAAAAAPRLRRPFVLVLISDSFVGATAPTARGGGGSERVDVVLRRDPRLLAWYANNPAAETAAGSGGDLARVRPYPRGIKARPDQWERELLHIAHERRSSSGGGGSDGGGGRSDTAGRQELVCCCCMASSGARALARVQLARNGIVCDAERLPLPAYMRKLSNCKFVISPPGNGWSNHREWEALNLGAVPVVLSHAGVNPVYGALPVLIVESYEQVTVQFLEREWQRRFGEGANPSPAFSMERVYWPWW